MPTPVDFRAPARVTVQQHDVVLAQQPVAPVGLTAAPERVHVHVVNDDGVVHVADRLQLVQDRSHYLLDDHGLLQRFAAEKSEEWPLSPAQSRVNNRQIWGITPEVN